MFETVTLWLIVMWAISGVWLVAASGWGAVADRRPKSANKSRSSP